MNIPGHRQTSSFVTNDSPTAPCCATMILLSLANQPDGGDGPPTFAKATAGRPGRPSCSARPAVAPYRRRSKDLRPGPGRPVFIAVKLTIFMLQLIVPACFLVPELEAGALGGASAVPAATAPASGACVNHVPNGVEVLAGGMTVRVQYNSAGSVHVTKSLPGATPGRASLIVLPRVDAPLDIVCSDETASVTLNSKRLRVDISKSDGAISFSDASGTVLLAEAGAASITPAAVAGEPRAYSIETRFKLEPGEGIYGLGAHQAGVMNYRGHTVKLVQANTQSAIPFMVSTRGYGVLWDNYSKTIFTDTGASCSIWSEVADGIDYHFINGGSMDGAIAGYRELTGAAPLYGKWAYGYWQSKEHYEDREELLKVAAEYRTRGIPIDGIVQDWDYWDGRDNWNQLFFYDRLFPRPTEMIDILHRQHFHFMISIWCGFGPKTPVYQEMERRGFLYPTVGWAGFKFFDPYNPAVADLYWKYVKEGLFSHGVDGWWMDSTEPDIVNAQTKDSQEYEMKRTGSNHLGTFARYLNTYPLMATESVYRNQRRETDRKRVYILTRSTFAGQQRAAATTWSGDIGASWEVYRNQISAGVNHSMSGIPYWTFDIGAFVLGGYGGVFCYGGKDPAYQELYTRMFQFGAFCPIFRSHGSDTPREIWEFGKFSDVLIAFDRLRYRLLPYIYSNAWKITSEGYTLMRGLPMDFPGDGKTYDISDQFMFGSGLMVCPVTEYMLHRPPGKSMLVSGEHFRTKDGKPGLDATYFGDDHFGTAVHSQTESNVRPLLVHRLAVLREVGEVLDALGGQAGSHRDGAAPVPCEMLRSEAAAAGRKALEVRLHFCGGGHGAGATRSGQGVQLLLCHHQFGAWSVPSPVVLENPHDAGGGDRAGGAPANPARLSPGGRHVVRFLDWSDHRGRAVDRCRGADRADSPAGPFRVDHSDGARCPVCLGENRRPH